MIACLPVNLNPTLKQPDTVSNPLLLGFFSEFPDNHRELLVWFRLDLILVMGLPADVNA
jgi:hypothetical protein